MARERFEKWFIVLFFIGIILGELYALNISCSADGYGHISIKIFDEKRKNANVVIALKKGRVNVAGVSKHNLALPYIWRYTVDEVGNYTCAVIDMDEGKLYQQHMSITLPKKMQKVEKEKREQQGNLAILVMIVGFALVVILVFWILFMRDGGKNGKK
jgi:hypothetical protein